MTEQWTFNADKTSATVTGRVEIPNKRFFFWGFGNDSEQNIGTFTKASIDTDKSKNDYDYMKGWPQPIRWLFWQCRNPLQNARSYIWGCQDQNYTVTTDTPPVDVTQRNDIGQTGWQRATIQLPSGKTRSFHCYCCKLGTVYWGTQWGGFWGWKFNGIFYLVPAAPIAAIAYAVFRLSH